MQAMKGVATCVHSAATLMRARGRLYGGLNAHPCALRKRRREICQALTLGQAGQRRPGTGRAASSWDRPGSVVLGQAGQHPWMSSSGARRN
jgi:hypothetical protein